MIQIRNYMDKLKNETDSQLRQIDDDSLLIGEADLEMLYNFTKETNEHTRYNLKPITINVGGKQEYKLEYDYITEYIWLSHDGDTVAQFSTMSFYTVKGLYESILHTIISHDKN